MGCFCCPEQREESAGVTSGAREGPKDTPSAPLHRPHPPSATQAPSPGVELGARAQSGTRLWELWASAFRAPVLCSKPMPAAPGGPSPRRAIKPA
uniref:Uncharacterized protein n=1 Tax=Strix occidentalis caurina TaxID=311401 RepID=A0A8D0F2B2_STROC